MTIDAADVRRCVAASAPDHRFGAPHAITVAGPPVSLSGRRRPSPPLVPPVPLPLALPSSAFLCVAKLDGRCGTRTHDLSGVNPIQYREPHDGRLRAKA